MRKSPIVARETGTEVFAMIRPLIRPAQHSALGHASIAGLRDDYFAAQRSAQILRAERTSCRARMLHSRGVDKASPAAVARKSCIGENRSLSAARRMHLLFRCSRAGLAACRQLAARIPMIGRARPRNVLARMADGPPGPAIATIAPINRTMKRIFMVHLPDPRHSETLWSHRQFPDHGNVFGPGPPRERCHCRKMFTLRRVTSARSG
jgi:hypothetical protein